MTRLERAARWTFLVGAPLLVLSYFVASLTIGGAR